LGGGGRYDDLTGIFGLNDISGVGISFGLDRIYDVLEELELFPATVQESTQLLFVNFDEAGEAYCFNALQEVRAAGLAAELYPSAAKLKKQMAYADKKQIPFVVLAGSEEIQQEVFTLKNMRSGQQEKLNLSGLIQRIQTSYTPHGPEIFCRHPLSS
jgi:histidyl-tRNA synthetase